MSRSIQVPRRCWTSWSRRVRAALRWALPLAGALPAGCNSPDAGDGPGRMLWTFIEDFLRQALAAGLL